MFPYKQHESSTRKALNVLWRSMISLACSDYRILHKLSMQFVSYQSEYVSEAESTNIILEAADSLPIDQSVS